MNYLRHLRDTWRSILTPGHLLDAVTAGRLESLCPALSSDDAEHVDGMFAKQSIFPAVTDANERSEIRNRLRSIHSLIPTLRTFFENLKYLEPISAILKNLTLTKEDSSTKARLGDGVTVRQLLFASFDHPQRIPVIFGSGREYTLPCSTAIQDRQLAYEQLWLAALRGFPELTDFAPRKDPGHPKVPRRLSSATRWQDLASLARRLGFCGQRVDEFQQEDGRQTAAEDLFSQLDLGPASLDGDLVEKMKEVLRGAEQISTGECEVVDGMPLISLSAGEPIERRCGMPFERSHRADARFLYRPILAKCSAPRSRGISSLFVKADLLRCLGLDTSDGRYSYGDALPEGNVDPMHIVSNGDLETAPPENAQVLPQSSP